MTRDSREVPVTVIIVTFASQDVVGRTLSALASAHDSGLLDCLVVDNASPDRTREVVASDHPWVGMIASPKNLGYGRACNLGFNEVTTPYVLFMNPDVEIQPAGSPDHCQPGRAQARDVRRRRAIARRVAV